MEGVAHRDDLVAATVRSAPLAGELDGGLVGLGAGVAEEHLAVKTGDLDKLLRKKRLRLVDEEVRAVAKLGDLILNGLDYALGAVTDVVHADSARHVIVLLAARIVNAGTFRLGYDDRGFVGRHQVLIVEFLRFFRVHYSVISVPTPSRVNISNKSECGMRPSTR